jgi:hypothetical protein
MYILSIHNDRVIVRNYTPLVITSARDFGEFLISEAARHGVNPDDLIVAVSSTMDFPEEATSNPETIALARELRGPKPWENI